MADADVLCGCVGPMRFRSAASPARMAHTLLDLIDRALSGLLYAPSVRGICRARLPGLIKIDTVASLIPVIGVLRALCLPFSITRIFRMLFANLKWLFLSFALLGLAGAADAVSLIPRRDQPSASQSSFLCLPAELETNATLSQQAPNRTTCDCATLEAPEVIVLTVQPNVTDFADPQQCSDYGMLGSLVESIYATHSSGVLPVLVSARGTGEAPGWSAGVHGMTLRTLGQVPNGAYYPVRYPASFDQNTTQGSRDVCHQHKVLKSNADLSWR